MATSLNLLMLIFEKNIFCYQTSLLLFKLLTINML